MTDKTVPDELAEQITEIRRFAADTTDRVLADRIPKLIAAFEAHEAMLLDGEALVDQRDLAAVLDFVVGRGPITVVDNDALDRLFAALKDAIARGDR